MPTDFFSWCCTKREEKKQVVYQSDWYNICITLADKVSYKLGRMILIWWQIDGKRRWISVYYGKNRANLCEALSVTRNPEWNEITSSA